jgi:hypothetical protein
MLRALLLLLLAANLAYWAWWRGWLPAEMLPLPRGEAGQREPHRLAAQRNPESIEILSAPQAERLAAQRCLQAGPFDEAAWPAVEASAAQFGLSASQWQRVPAETPASGALLRLPDADAATEAQLQAEGERVFGAPFRACP